MAVGIDSEPNYFKIFFRVFFAILAIGLIFGSTYVVGSGQRGVIVSKFHGTQQESYGEGIHFKLPLVDKAIKVDVRTKAYNSQASSASKDLQIVTTEVTLNYHLNPGKVHTIYQEIGPGLEDTIIKPSIQEIVKATTAQYDAEDLIEKRSVVKENIKQSLSERLAVYNIILDDLSITQFDFSEEFNHAIEAKVTSLQKALEEENNLKVVEFQAQQKVAQARGEAEALRIINEELQRSPQYINYLIANKWNGVMPLALGSGNLLSITPQQTQ